MISGNVIVCAACLMKKLRSTGAAAAKLTFPGCDARIVQVPVPTKAPFDADTLQVVVVIEANTTASPDELVAFSAIGESDSGWSAMASKVIDCTDFAIVVLVVTSVAAR